MTSVRVGPEAGTTRDGLRAALRAQGIDTRPVFPAISRYPMWAERRPPGAVADAIGRSAINLPSGVCLTRAQVARVGAAIRAAVQDRALPQAA
jgi:perosamine synthetase